MRKEGRGWEGTEELRNVFMSENEGNAADLSGEVILESVGSPEEEVKFNTPISSPHLNICKGPPSLEGEWNPAAVSSVNATNIL